ncbi:MULTISPECIES: Nramp family divalent metal transporter [unclassified Sporolactobacillus]|uniref:Nramp family divalent metal transporter n=1 Tax=unclassified Sporolactobacillus TaxID=2628533 RepID=UPI0023677843|nr:Nramp family divalent metal transporter [Sporolactobacillus sp. CQH2019]MDD9149136.1 Nramp family divalent metal transporter [Sporolactobacillus sp. CQH2019]
MEAEMKNGTHVAEDKLTKARVVKSPAAGRLLTFLMVFGPGLIVMEADNDAGAVSTYTQAGAQYGTRLLWVLLILLPVTYFCQEMVVRLGIATGEGHAAMIYKRFGKWWGRFSLFDLELVNFLTLITEFAAISLALSKMGISPYLSVPVSAIGLIFLVVSGGYLRWERVTIVLCLLDAVWLLLAFMSHPAFGRVAHDLVVPGVPGGGMTGNLVFMIIAIIGTTVAPWQLFFQQSCIADKKLRFKDLPFERLDTLIGAVFTVIIAGSMMLIGNVLFQKGIGYRDPAQMAGVLGPVLGSFGKNAVLLLMCNAAVLGTMAISLSSSWAYGEVVGWEHTLRKKFREAPQFYCFFVGAIASAAGIVLIPNAPLQLIIVGVQVLAGLMLPSAIVFLQLLLNDKELLGERFSNKPWNNAINWVIITILFILSAILAVQVMLPGLFS